MANNAVYTQLPIMVKRPGAVWPGLDQVDMERRSVAGDGNCLFASLSDQIYGTTTRHLEIRAAVIDHMRTWRPLFENICIKDDLQQKRATRRATNEIQNSTTGDGFEDYLAIMARPGAYGGEPELSAFCQSFDQDVTVHLPEGPWLESHSYTNPHRASDAERKPSLHICYDNKPHNAHYDSSRKATSKNKKASASAQKTTIQKTRQQKQPKASDTVLNSRDSRNRRSSGKEMMHEMVTKGAKNINNVKDSLERLSDSDRAQSPSINSQKSTSSKRSHEDDSQPDRAIKRVNRIKSALNSSASESSTSKLNPANIKTKLQSGLATPASTQDGDYSSDQSDRCSIIKFDEIQRRKKLEPKSPARSITPENKTRLSVSSHDGSITSTPKVSSPRQSPDTRSKITKSSPKGMAIIVPRPASSSRPVSPTSRISSPSPRASPGQGVTKQSPTQTTVEPTPTQATIPPIRKQSSSSPSTSLLTILNSI